MHNDYADIRDRIAEPPKWWDENAVPRYCDFAPHEVANIYRDEAALVEIACQSCGTHFLVAFSSDRASWLTEQYALRSSQGMTDDEWKEQGAALNQRYPLADSITRKQLHYGDPPNIFCCPAGPSMNCNDLRVCEYWRRDHSFDWIRHSDLEILLDSIYEGK